MIEKIMELTGAGDLVLDDNVLFVVSSLMLLYCLGYIFNFFQTWMERLTARRGR